MFREKVAIVRLGQRDWAWHRQAAAGQGADIVLNGLGDAREVEEFAARGEDQPARCRGSSA